MSGNIKLDAKRILSLDDIVKITSESNDTQVPLTTDQIRKIADVANRLNITLPLDVLNTLYDNKSNVKFINSYIQPRLIKFFTAKKMLPSQNDKYFNIKILNLCVKVKKDTLTFEDTEVSQTKLFNDLESLKVACKLYIWNVKLSNCATLNLLDETEIIAQYTKETGRLCRIANVPVKYEPPEDAEQTDEDSSLNQDESNDQGEGSTDQGDESNDQGEGSTDQGEGSTDQGEGSTDQGDGSTESKPTPESFNNIEKFSNNLTDNDYQFIITTAVFLFILYLIYVHYKI